MKKLTAIALLLLAGTINAQRIHVTKEAYVGDYAIFLNWGPTQVLFVVQAREAATGKLIATKFMVGPLGKHGMRGIMLVRVPIGGIIWITNGFGTNPRVWYTSPKARSVNRGKQIPSKLKPQLWRR